MKHIANGFGGRKVANNCNFATVNCMYHVQDRYEANTVAKLTESNFCWLLSRASFMVETV